MTEYIIRPDCEPVHIGGGPGISTWGTDLYYTVRVNGVPKSMPVPFPDAVPIEGTPYMAYALQSWPLNQFAIRLREGAEK